jgi:hypothetical protein
MTTIKFIVDTQGLDPDPEELPMVSAMELTSGDSVYGIHLYIPEDDEVISDPAEIVEYMAQFGPYLRTVI